MAGRDWSIDGRYVEYCSCDAMKCDTAELRQRFALA